MSDASLVLDLEGYEGPIDMLLALAREQKVDLARISILKLADQYLAYIAQARSLKLEIAADYLVMAAALAHQLLRLEAMQQAGVRIMARPQLGRDVFGRGAPEGLPRVLVPVWDVSLYDLLKGYGDGRQRKEGAVLHITPPELLSMDDALQRLSRMLGRIPD